MTSIQYTVYSVYRVPVPYEIGIPPNTPAVSLDVRFIIYICFKSGDDRTNELKTIYSVDCVSHFVSSTRLMRLITTTRKSHQRLYNVFLSCAYGINRYSFSLSSTNSESSKQQAPCINRSLLASIEKK